MNVVSLARSDILDFNPAVERVRRLGELDQAGADRFAAALFPPRRQSVRATLAAELNRPVTHRALLSGWAGRVRILADGRRQIVELFVPGDLIQIEAGALSGSDTVVALTDIVSSAVDPAVWQDEPLTALELKVGCVATRLLRNQIMRLGRQSAYERLGHLLLELRERQAAAGFDVRTSFAMPLTQEMLGEALGLTTVHLNRTMQLLRRELMVRSTRNGVELLDPDTLARMTDYQPLSA
jgi:CRP-like cAMP-binding protein